MILSVEDIKAFSQCPRYFRLLKNEDRILLSSSLQHSIIESVIKKAYLQITETGIRMDWRRILGLVDAYVFSKVDIQYKDQVKHARIMVENILASLQKWYMTIYSFTILDTFIDIPLKAALNFHTITGTIPLIQSDKDGPVVIVIEHTISNARELYNDLAMRSLAWLVYQELDCNIIKCTALGIGVKGSNNIVSMILDKDDQKHTGDILSQITKSISNGIDYPSYTSHCETCIFNRRCKL